MANSLAVSSSLISASRAAPLFPSLSSLRASSSSPIAVSAVRAIRVSCSTNKTHREDDVTSGVISSESLSVAGAALLPLLMFPDVAGAVGGEFGILEGRSFALVHPLVEGTLFFFTLYAGYLGYQWRRVREIGDEIQQLKKEVPAESTGSNPAQEQIEKLTEDRKVLVKGNFRDRHFNAGSVLLGAGVTISVAGCINTWMRTGKLFPGPHLWGGASITILWALAAALVPAMQKGNKTARDAHVALNALNVLLFVSQIPTGLEIVGKVFEFTTWP